MDEFKRQLELNLLSDINEFNTKTKYSEIRKLYIDEFEKIKSLIIKFGHHQSVEDIANLNDSTKQIVHHNQLLLKEINKAVENGTLTKNGIKNDT